MEYVAARTLEMPWRYALSAFLNKSATSRRICTYTHHEELSNYRLDIFLKFVTYRFFCPALARK